MNALSLQRNTRVIFGRLNACQLKLSLMEKIMNRSLIASIAALGVIASPAVAAGKPAPAQKTQVKKSVKVAAKAPAKATKPARRG